MSAKDSGGSAFPVAEQTRVDGAILAYAEPGMTLRDWFAGQVVGHVASDPTMGRTVRVTSADDVALQLARVSYAIADAMLAERSK